MPSPFLLRGILWLVMVIDNVVCPSMRQAAKELGVAQSTLMNRIKAGIGVEEALSAAHTEREKMKGQSKPMLYGNKLYPSARHLLLANPELVAGGDFDLVVAKLNDRARRAKNRGEIENLSIDEISARYGLPKVRFVDEFDDWCVRLVEHFGDAVLRERFYVLK